MDGTKEFIKRNGQFTVNIALAYKHQSMLGVIYVPMTEELYFACKRMGAYLQLKDGSVEQIHVSDNVVRASLLVVLSGSHGCTQMDGSEMTYNREDSINKKGFMLSIRWTMFWCKIRMRMM